MHLKGPRSVHLDVQLEIYKFSSNVIEESLELPANVTAPVSDFTTIKRKGDPSALHLRSQEKLKRGFCGSGRL